MAGGIVFDGAGDGERTGRSDGSLTEEETSEAGTPEAGEAPGRRADTAKRQSWMRTSPGVRKTPSISGAATDRMP